MKRTTIIAAVSVFVVGLAVAIFAVGGPRSIREFLTGYEEVPSVSTAGNAVFSGRISNRLDEVEYTLSYDDLEGNVSQSHIHIGQKSVNGGITVFLCTNLGNGPVGTQPCPPSPASISGIIRPADVSPNIPSTAGARTQGLNTGEWEEFLAALRAGVLYVNVHTDRWPGGEVRSQIALNHGHENHKP